ncbi:hypothetical protein GGR50DRAFT_655806 [Xylaria sp. CBS 124048]|nr:hypothetical protein GGR50DRAFT_655806 [Xylaria sp. CBS 124048]
MGIKGIYKEIGAGKRVSLTKLAVQKLEESGRPLRVAVDISIWQFQAQAAQGGMNPAVRTLFYRLIRLLSLSIQPIFVFDGPYKPAFKRNKRSGRRDGVADAMAKRLIRLFGCVMHDAPGEAEAECALLQQAGIVDAVLSEDVDTIMFGCTRTLRNWSSEHPKANSPPTHVSIYETQDLGQSQSGLDREGLVLVALMSGGDYIPEGVPGIGIKVACEAAKAGFGKSLCKIKLANTSELASWKEWLSYELQHNESGFFRTRHKALRIPEEFPNMEVLRYYTHPVVSTAEVVERLRNQRDRKIDIQGLREFARETFDWNNQDGAIKFIRVLAPSLLMRKLVQRSIGQVNANKDANVVAEEESDLIKSISNERAHLSTDGTPELRVSYIPSSIVGYDFEQEPRDVIAFGRDGIALNSDDEMGDAGEVGEGCLPGKPKSAKPFNPTELDLLWVPAMIVRHAIPSIVEIWEETKRAKIAARSKPKKSTQKSKTSATAAGGLDKFVKVTKNVPQTTTTAGKSARPPPMLLSSPARPFFSPEDLPLSLQDDLPLHSSGYGLQNGQPVRPSKQSTSKSRSRKKSSEASKTGTSVNPWTLAGSQSSSRVIKTISSSSIKASEPILLSSSPPASPPTNDFAHMSNAKGSYRQSKIDQFTIESPSPRKKRLSPPSRPRVDVFEAEAPSVKKTRPTATPNEKSQRKLVRTESLPPDSTPPRRRTRELTRSKTIAVETPKGPDHDSDSDADSELDSPELPPLESIMGRSKRGKNAPSTPTKGSRSAKPSAKSTVISLLSSDNEQDATDSEKEKQTLKRQEQTAPRMTKLYVRRKSAVGFFREMEVSAEEADAALAAERREAAAVGNSQRGRRGIWRLSDISIVDLSREE